jgi:hypothetical protein
MAIDINFPEEITPLNKISTRNTLIPLKRTLPSITKDGMELFIIRRLNQTKEKVPQKTKQVSVSMSAVINVGISSSSAGLNMKEGSLIICPSFNHSFLIHFLFFISISTLKKKRENKKEVPFGLLFASKFRDKEIFSSGAG